MQPKVRIRKGPEIDWIAAYRGGSSFLLSLQAQAAREGLSPRQIDNVRENMKREAERIQPSLPSILPMPQPKPNPHFSVRSGDQLEIKHFVARRIADEQGLEHAFRNLEVVEVLRESAKAIQVRVKYASKIASSCHLCGQPLDTEISRACGIGPVCAEKLGFKRPKIADAAAILAEMEKLAARIGVIGPVWVPKSQIVDQAHVADTQDDIAMKNEYAKREAEQERQAFLAKEEVRDRMSRR